MERRFPPYQWIDHLEHKHECFKYDDTRSMVVEHGGRSIKLTLPEETVELTPLTIFEANRLLTIVGRLKKDWNGKPLGVMLVAIQRGEDEFEVCVWHVLYPWALKQMGFVPLDEK